MGGQPDLIGPEWAGASLRVREKQAKSVESISDDAAIAQSELDTHLLSCPNGCAEVKDSAYLYCPYGRHLLITAAGKHAIAAMVRAALRAALAPIANVQER